MSKLPSSWILAKVSEIAYTSSGGTPSRNKPENYNGTIPWIKSGNLNDGTIHEADEFISPLALKNSSAKLFPIGSILIALYGATIGKLGILSIEAATNQAVCGIFSSKHVSQKFLFSFLIFQRRSLIKLGKGGAQPNISQLIVRGIQVPLPPHAEQKRIVTKIEELFSELDAGEESFKLARKQLGIYRQSLLKQAFEGKLTEAWRKANPDQLEDPDQLLARIQQERECRHQQQLTDWQQAVEQWEQNGKEGKKPTKPRKLKPYIKLDPKELTDLHSVPSSWSWQKLEFCYFESVLGKMLDKAKNKGILKPYLRNINVRWGAFNLDALLEIPIEHSEIPRYRIEIGDLIVCEGGEPGRCAVWTKSMEDDVFLQKALHRIRFPESLDVHLVQLYFAFVAESKRLESFFTGTTIKHLTGQSLAQIPYPICSLREQQEIVRLLEEQFTVIEQNEREIDAALKRSEALRQSILKRAFSGQLVPQDPTDEPASVLLERIQEERKVKSELRKVKKTAKKKTAKKTARKRPKKS